MTLTSEFEYDLPAAAIAQHAVEPRDAARLLDVATMQDRTFSELGDLLAPGDLLVVNSTRVRAARLEGVKADTGGAVEVLLLERDGGGVWRAMCRPARRVRPGQQLRFGPLHGEVVTGPVDGVIGLRLDAAAGSVEDHLPRVGKVPLPPYFHGALGDDERYQTIFAKDVGSAAAPTAGLHFTPGLVTRLAAGGIGLADVDLHVGLDTFRPISERTIEEHGIHRERFNVPAATAEQIAATRDRSGRVVAVGTTVVRALETAAAADGAVAPGERESSLFIRPGYRFRVVDALVTNFHAPATSLVVLVAAILGEAWREVYAAALARGYRFLSFGDAMFIDDLRSR